MYRQTQVVRMQQRFCYLYLACKDEAEAAKIAQVLLDKRLIACAKHWPVQSSFWWKGQITSDSEQLLLMESSLDLFENIEKEVSKLHSYDTFVLEAVPVEKLSGRAITWMKENLSHG